MALDKNLQNKVKKGFPETGNLILSAEMSFNQEQQCCSCLHSHVYANVQLDHHHRLSCF